MDILRCPVCGHKVGIFQKYRQSIWGGIRCSSCGTQLHIKKYGTGRADAFLPVAFVYFFLGIKDWIVPASLLAGFVYHFIKCSLSPLIPLEQNQEASWKLWIYILAMATGLLVALLSSFIAK